MNIDRVSLVLQVRWSTLASGCKLSRLTADWKVGSAFLRRVSSWGQGPPGTSSLLAMSQTQTKHLPTFNALAQNRIVTSSHIPSPKQVLAKLSISGVGKYTLPILIAPQCHMAKGVTVYVWFGEEKNWDQGPNLPHSERLVGELLQKSRRVVTKA